MNRRPEVRPNIGPVSPDLLWEAIRLLVQATPEGFLYKDKDITIRFPVKPSEEGSDD